MNYSHQLPKKSYKMNFKTKSQLANDFGISLRTFQRRLKSAELDVPRGLISPQVQQEIKENLNVETQQN